MSFGLKVFKFHSVWVWGKCMDSHVSGQKATSLLSDCITICQASKGSGTACRSLISADALADVSVFALCLELVLNLFRALVLIRSTTGFSAFFQLPRQQSYFPDWPNVPRYCLQETISNKLSLQWKSISLLITMMDDTLLIKAEDCEAAI